MKEMIDQIIIEYINMTKRFQKKLFLYEKDLLSNLDWDVLALCVFLSLPDKCFEIASYNFDSILEEMEFILRYCNVETEPIHFSLGDHTEKSKVRIKGYMLPNETGHVPCFYMLCLLIYCHVITDEKEKERFLQCMLVAPAYDKFWTLSDENVLKITKKFVVLTSKYDFLEEGEGQELFDTFLRKYDYLDHLSTDERFEILEIRDNVKRGFAYMNLNRGC